MRKKVTIIAAVLLALIIVIVVVLTSNDDKVKEVIIGNQDSKEQDIIGELMKQLLEDRGFKVQLVSGLSPVGLREGMEAATIDICAGYTGMAWREHLGHERKPGMDNNELYRLVKQEDHGNGLIWLKPMWNNKTYALASWASFSVEHGLTTLSDLASLYREKEGEIRTSVCYEFGIRTDGLPALKKHYNFEIAESSLQIESSLKTSGQSLKKRECDVAMVSGTDPAIYENKWYVYADHKDFFPPYDLTPYVRREIIDKYSEIPGILNELVGTFPGGGVRATPEIVAECRRVWQKLNLKVDVEEMEPAEVAHEYLVEHGLVKE